MATAELDSSAVERIRAISSIAHGETPTGGHKALAQNADGELTVDSLEDLFGALLEQMELLTLAFEASIGV
jgi:hypothetical protein